MRTLLGLLAIALLLPALFAQAEKTSYEIPLVDSEIIASPDGSFSVTENMTIAFQGEFKYMYMDLPLSSPTGMKIQLSGISVYDGEQVLQRDISVQNGSARVLWWFTAKDEQKTFTLKYVVKNQVVAYSDVADLSWAVYGGDDTASAGEVHAFVRLPEGVSDADVYAWAHGQRSSQIGVKGGVVEILATGVPPKTQVEVRALFPSSAINGTFVSPAPGQGLVKIIQEEKDRIGMERNSDMIAGMIPYLPLAFPILLLFAFGALWAAYGREHKVEFEQGYFHEPPYGYSPAVLGALMDSVKKKPGADAFIGTVLDLAQRGYVKMERGKGRGAALSLAKMPDENLKGHEADALRCVFGKRDVFAIASAKRGALSRIVDSGEEGAAGRGIELEPGPVLMGELGAGKDRGPFAAYFEIWQEDAMKECRKYGFHEERAGRIARYFGIACGLLLVIFIPLVLLFSMSAPQDSQKSLILIGCMLIAFFTGLGIEIHGSKALQKRTPKGALHYEKWMAFRKFVSDGALLKQYPPETAAIWNKYLVYGAALGCADKVAGAMRAGLSEELLKNGEDCAWYAPMADSESSDSALKKIESGLAFLESSLSSKGLLLQ